MARNEALILARLEEGCADCGETDPDVLEFDHVPERGAKLVNIRSMRSWPVQRLMDELEKCDVVCANDHRRRTRARRVSTAAKDPQGTAPDLSSTLSASTI